jgi:hypothetical protein
MRPHAISQLFPEPLKAFTVTVNKLIIQKDGGLELGGDRQPDDGGKLLARTHGQFLEPARSSRGNKAFHVEVGIELNVSVKVTGQ